MWRASSRFGFLKRLHAEYDNRLYSVGNVTNTIPHPGAGGGGSLGVSRAEGETAADEVTHLEFRVHAQGGWELWIREGFAGHGNSFSRACRAASFT